MDVWHVNVREGLISWVFEAVFKEFADEFWGVFQWALKALDLLLWFVLPRGYTVGCDFSFSLAKARKYSYGVNTSIRESTKNGGTKPAS